MGIWAWYSSRSLSAVPAVLCSPSSSGMLCKMVSNLASSFTLCQLGQASLVPGLHCNPDDRAHAELYHLRVWVCCKVVMVPVFTRNWSTLTRIWMFLQGMSSIMACPT